GRILPEGKTLPQAIRSPPTGSGTVTQSGEPWPLLLGVLPVLYPIRAGSFAGADDSEDAGTELGGSTTSPLDEAGRGVGPAEAEDRHPASGKVRPYRYSRRHRGPGGPGRSSGRRIPACRSGTRSPRNTRNAPPGP